MTNTASNTRKYLAISLMVAIIVISIGGSILIIQHWEYVEKLHKHGYWGLFVISVFAGSPIPIPTPSMILTFTLGSILNPLLVGLVAGFGNGVGNALIYWTGQGGHHLFRSLVSPEPSQSTPRTRVGRFIKKMSQVPEFIKNKVLWALFILSIYPNPILLPLILGMGAARYHFWKFFLVIWAGKTIQSLILSYLGYYGLRSLLRYMGVFDVP